MPEEFIGEGAELGGKGEEMTVIFPLVPWYAEEGPSGEQLKDKAPETPDVEGFVVDGSSKN